MKELIKCTVCPHNCKVNRIEGKVGFCRASNKAKIALADLFLYEEPCISRKEWFWSSIFF